MSISDVSSITRGLDAIDVGKRERAREWVKKVNETLTFKKMRAATPCQELPYYYYPDRGLGHFPPKWYLGFLITFDDMCKFAQKQNLVAISTDPSDKDRRKAWQAVVNYLCTTWAINAACYATIESVYADASDTHYMCLSICSNYNVHLCPDDALDNMEDRLLELWDCTNPRLAWYLDAIGTAGAFDDEGKTEWPLDFSLVWEQKYRGQRVS
ncbi:hypothetical protein CPB85DRAFT_1561620 [Mucidula mucida]|nr:hypothetical protein CPB85DRAFT_1561620 [Mucidula mucida]